MGDDVLVQMLRMVRAELPAMPDATWAGIEAALRGQYGGEAHYIARRAKRGHLDTLDAHPDYTPDQLARLMGVSVRRVQQLRQLAGK